MNQGWIKIHRSIEDKGYYRDSEYIHLWVHLLLKVNHEEKEFLFNGKIIKIKRGQCVTGRKKLSQETGISESKIERILKLFESEQQIEQQTNNRNRIITIKNYNEYQKNEQPVNNKRTASEQPVNTNKNDKNIRMKECKNISLKKFDENSIEIKLSKVMFSLMRENNETMKEPSFQSWAAEFDKILRIDKRDIEQVKNMIVFIHGGEIDRQVVEKHDFWHKNILSPAKLRKHWDRLVLEIKSKTKTQSNWVNTSHMI